MSFAESIAPLIARLLLGWFFISQAFDRLANWHANVSAAVERGVPLAPAALALAAGAMICGGASLLIGFQTRFSAMVLSVCTFAWIFVVHDYWTIADPAARAADFQLFSLGVAALAGLLMLMGLGPGRIAFDRSDTEDDEER